MRNVSKKQALMMVFAALFFCFQTVSAIVPLNVGIALPLHNEDGDGARAIEYYRGLILAAEEMKQEGVEVNFYAWNFHEDADVNMILQDPNAKKCEIFFGPMYTKQLPALQAFAERQGAKVIIPFSISGNPAAKYSNVFQIYQEPALVNKQVIDKFVEFFSTRQVVIVGCNDTDTSKGNFTADLKIALSDAKIPYTVTNLTTSDELFTKAFNERKPNVVVLNSASNASLKAAFKKLDAVMKTNPLVTLSLFGYTEWLMYAKAYDDFFSRFDTYLPTHSYYNPASLATRSFEDKYQKWFNATLLTNNNPRLGILGYDHGRFFFRGFSKIGKGYKGTYANNDALQSRIHFTSVGENAGMQNVGFKFIHYNRNQSVSEIVF